jgi:hypothetical protein
MINANPGNTNQRSAKHPRHLSNIDCLMSCTTYLVYLISTVNGCSKKKKPLKTGTSSGHITNLKQSVWETFEIYAKHTSN